jgi:hypothetical protein
LFRFASIEDADKPPQGGFFMVADIVADIQ